MPTARLEDIEAPTSTAREGAQPDESTGAEAPGRHDWSSTQLNLPEDIAQAIRDFAAKIPDEVLAGDGREDESHITVLYGIDSEDPKTLTDALQGQSPVQVKLGRLSLFKNDDADVLKLDIASPDLASLNKALRATVPHIETYDGYEPHCTVAYLQPGEGKKFADRAIPGVTGKKLVIDTVQFSSKDGTTADIPLGEKSTDSGKPVENTEGHNPAKHFPQQHVEGFAKANNQSPEQAEQWLKDSGYTVAA